MIEIRPTSSFLNDVEDPLKKLAICFNCNSAMVTDLFWASKSCFSTRKVLIWYFNLSNFWVRWIMVDLILPYWRSSEINDRISGILTLLLLISRPPPLFSNSAISTISCSLTPLCRSPVKEGATKGSISNCVLNLASSWISLQISPCNFSISNSKPNLLSYCFLISLRKFWTESLAVVLLATAISPMVWTQLF